ncbi:MAG: hypothetical protein JWL87_284, partial [Candidatus Adlerbacteria bacterium]|nr:hypothetical protein [Candidatus Adlerbacteria bacterium]
TLATTGNIVTVTFTSDQTSLVSPTVSIAGHATTTATNTSGNTWTASTAMASDDIEGAVSFFITVGSSDGLATTSVSAITSGSNVTFDKTAPVITVSGSNPDTKYLSTAVYSDAGASATDGHDGTVSVVSSGSVDLISPGSYTITYTTTDAAGNSSSAARTVTVLSSGHNTGGTSIAQRVQNLIAMGNTEAAQDLDRQWSHALATTTVTQPSVDSLATRNLELSVTGEDVKRLQITLNASGFPLAIIGAGSPGNETSLFGPLTQNALIKYQQANKISPTIGYFGPITRAHMKSAGVTGIWW